MIVACVHVWNDVAADNVENAIAARDSPGSKNSRRMPSTKLPNELIELVLSLLPVPMLCKFRALCKEWEELLCDPRFHSSTDITTRIIVLPHEFCLTKYDCEREPWSTILLELDGPDHMPKLIVSSDKLSMIFRLLLFP